MAIKIQGDNMQYGDTAIATLSNDALTLQSGTSLNAQKLTASNGVEITNHMTAENGVVTVSGQLTASNGLTIYKSGTNKLFCSAPVEFIDDVLLGNSLLDIITVKGKLTAESHLTASNGLAVSGDATFSGDVTLGNALGDVTTVTGQLTASGGLTIGSEEGYSYYASTKLLCIAPAEFGNTATFLNDVILGNHSTDVITATGQLTASSGVEITNHMTAENGVVTVSGQLTASNGLAVSGDVSFEDATFSGDVTLGNAAGDVTTVTGQLTASNGINVMGDMYVSRFASFYAAGDVTLGYSDDDSQVVLRSTIYGDLNPASDSNWSLGSSVLQWAEAHVDHGHIDDITSTGTSNLATVNVTGQLTASNGLAVSGDVSFEDATFSGDVTLGDASGDTITVTGRFGSDLIPTTGDSYYLGSDVYTWAQAHIGGVYADVLYLESAAAGIIVSDTFVVSKSSNNTSVYTKLTASNGISITDHLLADNGVVTISGQLTASNGLAVSGDASFEDATFSGGATFSGDVTLGNGREDTITIGGNATFSQQLTASNGIAVEGDATFTQRATFSGVTTVSSHLTASGGIRSNGSSWFGSEVEIAGDLQANGDVTLGDGATDVINVTGQLTASNGARIAGNVQITGDLTTTGDVTLGNGTADVTTISGHLTASNGAEISGDVILGSDDSIKAGSYITYSDATLKENIEVISNPIDKVMSMRGVTYNFKNNSNNSEVGFLAQEMRQSVPEVVYGNGDGNLGIDYAKLTSVLVEAIKTQQVQIQEQQSQIDELKESLLKNK